MVSICWVCYLPTFRTYGTICIGILFFYLRFAPKGAGCLPTFRTYGAICICILFFLPAFRTYHG